MSCYPRWDQKALRKDNYRIPPELDAWLDDWVDAWLDERVEKKRQDREEAELEEVEHDDARRKRKDSAEQQRLDLERNPGNDACIWSWKVCKGREEHFRHVLGTVSTAGCTQTARQPAAPPPPAHPDGKAASGARQPAAQGSQRREAASGAMSPPTPSPPSPQSPSSRFSSQGQTSTVSSGTRAPSEYAENAESQTLRNNQKSIAVALSKTIFVAERMDMLNLGCSSRRIMALLENQPGQSTMLCNPFSTHSMLGRRPSMLRPKHVANIVSTLSACLPETVEPYTDHGHPLLPHLQLRTTCRWILQAMHRPMKARVISLLIHFDEMKRYQNSVLTRMGERAVRLLADCEHKAIEILGRRHGTMKRIYDSGILDTMWLPFGNQEPKREQQSSTYRRWRYVPE